MQKGCQKRIYFIKNTNSRYFEEAYLVLKNDVLLTDSAKHNVTLADEAKRIIRDIYEPQQPKLAFSIGKAAAFALGAASSSALIGTIALLVGVG